jgi:predicted RNase H-like nuclease
MARVVGIDGCPSGWLAVVLDTESREVRPLLLDTLHELPFESIALVAIDIPLGLPDSGARSCDTSTRKRLGKGRSSSVFSAPIRPLLDCTTYSEACDLGRSIDGRAISKQTWNIIDKIRDADSFLAAPQRRFPVHEVHPELSFATWTDSSALPSKKTEDGKLARHGLVERYVPGAFIHIRSSLPRTACRDDDILDALAAVWSAERLHLGTALRFPSAPEYDSEGIRMQISA